MNQRGSEVRLVLISLERITIEKSLRLGLSATNNEAEYETLLEGMSMVQRMGRKAVKMFSDSRLVVGQVNGELEARDERMQGYLSQVRHLQSHFDSLAYCISLEVETQMPTPWPRLPPPRIKVYPGSSL